MTTSVRDIQEKGKKSANARDRIGKTVRVDIFHVASVVVN